MQSESPAIISSTVSAEWMQMEIMSRTSNLTPRGSPSWLVGSLAVLGCFLKNKNGNNCCNLGTLVGGRVGVSQGALNMSKMSLCIAIRYALNRRQFGEGDKERLLIDYLSHQRRLFPLLAKTFALQFAVNHLKRLFVNPNVRAHWHMPTAVSIYELIHLKDSDIFDSHCFSVVYISEFDDHFDESISIDFFCF